MAKDIQKELRGVFAKYVSGFLTKKAAAEDLKISQSYLQDLLSGARPITKEIAAKIGYTIETIIKKNE